jgi:hypothetical protein
MGMRLARVLVAAELVRLLRISTLVGLGIPSTLVGLAPPLVVVSARSIAFATSIVVPDFFDKVISVVFATALKMLSGADLLALAQ